MCQTGEELDLWVQGSTVTHTKVEGATTIASAGWILPGLVDAHCHVGLSAQGGVDAQTAERQALTDLDAGVTLIRDAGSPIDTHWLDARADMPRIIRAGRHVARTRRYLRDYAVEVEPEDLVAEVRRQARAGDGWVKIVGDWIDRAVGDLAPSWPEEVMAEAIRAAHDEGARVTAHCFGEESVHHLVRAGIDCVEHGCGLDEETMAIMAANDVALVPTLDNLEIFPDLADQAQDKFPTYAAHMRDLYACRDRVYAAALDAGVNIYCGSDAGGIRPHGAVLGEITALSRVGGPMFALGAASWRARQWLGAGDLEDGAPADIVIAREDPRKDVSALADLALVMVAGAIHRPRV